MGKLTDGNRQTASLVIKFDLDSARTVVQTKLRRDAIIIFFMILHCKIVGKDNV